MYFAKQIAGRLSTPHLDRELAAGADPGSSPALRHRAQALAKPASRAELAQGLREAVRAAGHRHRGASARAPVCARAVRGAAAELEALACEVAAGRDPKAQGLALTRLLLVDGDGPLYNAGEQQNLVAAVSDARRALRTDGQG